MAFETSLEAGMTGRRGLGRIVRIVALEALTVFFDIHVSVRGVIDRGPMHAEIMAIGASRGNGRKKQ